METTTEHKPRRRLSLWDATSISVGIIIGSSIYEVAPRIARNVESPAALIAVWAAGAIFALAGALCYAELATALPHAGGEYVYLGRAFGRRVAFLYAWAVLWVIRPGTIGSLAFIFARYAHELYPAGPHDFAWYALGIVVLLTGINMLGVRPGAWTQNALVCLKTLGLLAIVAAAFWQPAETTSVQVSAAGATPDLRLAMIMVVFVYGGWSDMPMVAAEVRHPERNLLRALVLGTLIVTAVYLLVNAACLYSLGFDGLRKSNAIAPDLVAPALGSAGGRLVDALICVTAAGAVNGMILTGARVTYAVGHDHAWLTRLGRWNTQFGGPLAALAVQALVSCGLIAAFGRGKDGFERMLNLTSPVFLTFFFLTAVALWWLRRTEPQLPRPYRVWGYPATWAVFALSSLFMLYSSISYAVDLLRSGEPWEAIWAAAVMATGAVLAITTTSGRAPASRE